MKHFVLPFIGVCILAATLLQSCDSGSSVAMGHNDVITIIADSAQYTELESALGTAFAPPLFTPQPEHWFVMDRINLLQLPNHKRGRNIVFVAPLDADNDVGEFLRSALDSSVKELVRSGEEHVFVKKDVWYDGQTVIYLTGNSMEDLENFIVNNTQQLFYYLKNPWDIRERNRMYRMPRLEDLEERLMSDYGWSMPIIEGWYIAKDSAEISSVLIRRQAPAHTERWMLVHWIDNPDIGKLTPAYAIKLRNRLTSILYKTYDDMAWAVVDTVNHLQFDETGLLDNFAWRISGLWRMNDYSMGGPFVSYFFYDKDQDRMYFIDGSVFAPKYKKKKLIQDVDIMMKEFRLKKSGDGDAPA